MKVRCVACSLLTFSVSWAAMAQVCTWNGAVDDTWSNPDNWEEGVVPGSSDTAIVEAANRVLEIDPVTGATAQTVEFRGTGRTELVGGTLSLTGTGGGWSSGKILSNSVELVCHVPVQFKGTGYLTGVYGAGGISFLKRVTTATSQEFRLHTGSDSKRIVFYDAFEAPNAAVRDNDGSAPVDFLGPLSARTLQFGNYNSTNFRIANPSNLIGSVTSGYKGSVEICGENVLSTNTVISQIGDSRSDNSYMGAINLNNFNQTINRIGGTKTFGSAINRAIRSYQGNVAAPTRLTLLGTADETTTYMIDDQISIVWDPLGDFTQTFDNRVNLTRGSISVRRGTVRVTGAGTFANAAAVNVSANATFDLATTAANALANVRRIRLGGDARFIVGADAATPFSGGVTVATVAKDGKFVVGEGQTVTLAAVCYDGVWQTAQDCVGAEWVTGGGSVTVDGTKVAVWKAPVSGDWETGDNWVGGAAPTASQFAYVDRDSGEDYVVTVKAAGALPAFLDVANFGSGRAVVDVKAALTHDKGRLLVGHGGTFRVSAGSVTANGKDAATSTQDNPVQIRDGGLYCVDGGTVTYSNYTGCFGVGGCGAETGRLEVASGSFSFTPMSSGQSIALAEGGTVAFTGGTVSLAGGLSAVVQCGGDLMAGGTAVVGGNDGKAIVSWQGGRFRVCGEAVWPSEAPPAMFNSVRRSLPGGTLSVSVEDSAAWGGPAGARVQIGGMPGGRFSGSIGGSASQNRSLGYLHVGGEAGSADVSISDGNFVVGRYGTFVGSTWNKTSPVFASGVLRISGGSYYNHGAGTTGWGTDQMFGFNVGYGINTSVVVGRPIEGLVEMSGGVVTNDENFVTVGTGFARGTWKHSGGTLVNKEGFWVGVAHGIGTFEQSGGTVSVAKDTHIGGAFTNEVGVGAYLVAKGWPIDRHDANGTLRLSGGTMDLAKTCYVGCDGTGTVEVVGVDASLTVKDLVLSNTVELATSSVLSFIADARGIAPIRVTNGLTVTPGAKLKVDITDLAAPHGRIHLVSAKSVTGTFDDVEVVDNRTVEKPYLEACVEVTATGVDLHLKQGAILILR